MAKKFRDFKPARKHVHRLGFKSQNEWREYCKSGRKPQDIPADPAKTYKKQWKGYGDWLGTGRIAPQDMQFRHFESARKHVHRLGLKSREEWANYCNSGKKPEDIPRAPWQIYKKQWKGWGDWLGTGRIAPQNMQFLDFKPARKHVHRLGLKSVEEWREYCKSGRKPQDIPANPARTYKKQWKGMGDWLGTGRIANFNMQFLDFKPARKHVHRLGLKSQEEWANYCNSGKKPEDIPRAPWRTYKNKGWKGFGDWLGTGTKSTREISKNYLPFKEAREQVRLLAKKYNLKNWEDYRNAVKKGLIPKNIPLHPHDVYSKNRVKNGKKKNNQ